MAEDNNSLPQDTSENSITTQTINKTKQQESDNTKSSVDNIKENLEICQELKKQEQELKKQEQELKKQELKKQEQEIDLKQIEKDLKQIEKDLKQIEKERKAIFTTIASLEDKERKTIFTTIASLEDKERKAIFSTIASLEDKERKAIFSTIASLEDKERKAIFSTIASLEDKERKAIFSTIREILFDKNISSSIQFLQNLQQVFVQPLIADKCYIETIVEALIYRLHNNPLNESKEQTNESKEQTNKSKEQTKQIQTLRSAIFRLLNKIKLDDISTYDAYKLETLMPFFDDMKRDEEIKKSSLYKQKNAQQNKRIKILKDCVLKPHQYTKLLRTIIRHKSYIDDHAMFNLLLYLVQFPPNVIELQPFLARYSFSFYKEHVSTKDTTIGINELFGHSGFVFRDTNVKNKENEISFEKLREFTYSSSIELEKDIKPYASHPDKHYIYYALTKNPNLSEDNKKYIANDVQKLDFLYPYTKEAQTILESIERATGKNDAKDEASHKKSTDTLEEVHEFYLYDGFEFALLEESAKYIAVVASKTLSEYISALQTFLSYVVSTLENLRKFGIDVESNNSFICYVLYLFECVRLDKKILYYETHYLDNIVHKLQSNMFFDAQNAELKLLNDYLQIKNYLLNVAFYALNYTSNNIPATKQIFELYNHTFNFLDKTITKDVYFELRDICYPSQNYIFLEYRFVKLGAKLKAIFEKRKSLLKNDCFDITSWETFCECLKEKDEKYLKDLKQKRYRCKTMEIAQAHERQMEKGNSIIEYYRNFESDDKLDDDNIEDWKFFIDKWNIAEDKK